MTQETLEEKSPVKVKSIAEMQQELEDIDMQIMPHGSTLTAQELYMLEAAGYEVVNLVIANIVYSMGLRGILKSSQRAFTRGEMTEFTRMNEEARDLVRNRLLKKAKHLGATDVIEIVYQTHEWADFVEITAMGTAIKKVGPARSIEVAVS